MTAQETAEDFLNKYRITFAHHGNAKENQIELLGQLLQDVWDEAAEAQREEVFKMPDNHLWHIMLPFFNIVQTLPSGDKK